MLSADADGLAGLFHRLGPDVCGCREMMSEAVQPPRVRQIPV
jgi:hypothetical protein